VRQRRPTLVVETGVANGYSTVLILSALKRNGHGRLLSVDVNANVGTLVRDEGTERWELSILPRRRRRSALAALIGGISEIDLFIHDSDHSYGWQAFEYAMAWPRLAWDGILFSDDVDSSRAFFDFCARKARRPVLLLDRRKLVGAVAARAARVQ
jgi:predicted O-methyltransferase YrrM